MTLDRRLAAALAAAALVGFAGCGGDGEEQDVQTPEDVQREIDEGQRQLEEGQQQAEDALRDAREAVEDPAGQLEQEAQERLQGEGGE